MICLQYFLNPYMYRVSTTSEPIGTNSGKDYKNFTEARAAKNVKYGIQDIFDG